jgi:two-component system, OmpR family, sensor kinase
VVIVVSDDEPGIAEVDRTRGFERFVRLDNARTRDAGGTGLGLAIVREVVAEHHGTITITITDTVPHGATFVVHLPRSVD